MQIELPELDDDLIQDEVYQTPLFARSFGHGPSTSGTSHGVSFQTPNIEADDPFIGRLGETALRPGLQPRGESDILFGRQNAAERSANSYYTRPTEERRTGSIHKHEHERSINAVRDFSPARAIAMQYSHSQASSSVSAYPQTSGSTDHGHSSSSATSYLPSPDLHLNDDSQSHLQRADAKSHWSGSVIAGKTSPTHLKHGKSNSLGMSNEAVRSSSEYALHVLFSLFVRSAEAKIQMVVMDYPIDREPNLPTLLGKGSDPAFDTILENLALLAKTRTRAVIDSVMLWRKSKAEGVDMAVVRSGLVDGSVSGYQIGVKEAAAILNGRKSLVSIFILSRALIEIVQKCNANSLSGELANKLEEIICNQLRSADLGMITRSANRRANIDLFAELLGQLSGLNFRSVGDRFLKELNDRSHSVMSKERQSRIELFLYSMRKLQIRIYPEDVFEEAADFLQNISRNFAGTHGMRLKHAYAEALVHLMLPVAATLTAEVNVPAWSQATDIILSKARDMLGKDRYTTIALPLVVTTLCVSPAEAFLQNWPFAVESCARLLKERSTRGQGYLSLLRLTWIYLFRCHESLSATSSKLDQITRLFWSSDRKMNKLCDIPLEVPALLIQSIVTRYPEYGLKLLFTTLLQEDALAGSAVTLSLDFIAPERAAVAIKAFYSLLVDFDNNRTRPDFPGLEDASIVKDAPTKDDGKPKMAAKIALPPHLKDAHNRLCTVMGKIATICDHFFAGLSKSFSDTRNLAPSVVSAPQATPVKVNTLAERDVTVTSEHAFWRCVFPAWQKPWFHLMRIYFDTWPHCLPNNIPLSRLVDMVCRCLMSVDFQLANSAADALLRMTETPSMTLLVLSAMNSYLLSLGESDKHMNEHREYITNRLDGVLATYQKILDMLQSSMLIGPDSMPDSRDVTSIWPIMEDVESIGLLYLCSQCQSMRSSGLEILRISSAIHVQISSREKSKCNTPDHDQPCGDSAESIYHIVCASSQKIFAIAYDHVIEHERGRLQAWIDGHENDGIARLAVSTDQIDCSLWTKVLPFIIKECVIRHPTIIALAKNVICGRLIAMQASIHDQAGLQTLVLPGNSDKLTNRSPQPSGIAEWCAYSTFACITITTIGENQSSSNGRARSRADSGQSCAKSSDNRIASAHDLFRVLIPILISPVAHIRASGVQALSHVNSSIYGALLQDLQSYVVHDAAIGNLHGTSKAQFTWHRQIENFRNSVSYILQATAPHLKEPQWHGDQFIRDTLLSVMRDGLAALNQGHAQFGWYQFQRSRKLLCHLVAAIIDESALANKEAAIITFDLQQRMFEVFGEWSDMGLDERAARTKDARILAEAAEQHEASNDKSVIIQALRKETKNMQIGALKAMASLCNARLSKNLTIQRGQFSYEIQAVLSWIRCLLRHREAENKAIAHKAMANLLAANWDDCILLDNVCSMCLADLDDGIHEYTLFDTVCDCVLAKNGTAFSLNLLALSILKLDSHHADRALKLLRATECNGERFFGASQVEDVRKALRKSSSEAQALTLQQIFASQPEVFHSLFGVCAYQIATNGQMGNVNREKLISIMTLWTKMPETMREPTQVLDLAILTTAASRDATSILLQSLWTNLAHMSKENGIEVLLDHLVMRCTNKGHIVWFRLAAKIVGFLCKDSFREQVLTYLYTGIAPSKMGKPRDGTDQAAMISTTLEKAFEIMERPDGLISAKLSNALVNVLLLAETNPYADFGMQGEADHRFTTLLHVCILHLTHFDAYIREQCVMIMHTLIRSAINDASSNHDPEQHRSQSRQLNTIIISAKQLAGGEADAQLHGTSKILALLKEILIHRSANLLDVWPFIALQWGTACPIRQLACQSFQILRSLESPKVLDGLPSMVARLSTTIGDPSPEVQSFTVEVIATIRVAVKLMSTEEVTRFPDLWWLLLACMCSPHEREYAEALRTMDILLDLWKPMGESIVCLILECMPSKIAMTNLRASQLLSKGLRSSETYEGSFATLVKLYSFPGIALLDHAKTFLHDGFLAASPAFLQSWSKKKDQPALRMAEALSLYAKQEGNLDLERILTSIHKGRFRTKEDLLKNMSNVFARSFLPLHSFDTLQILLSMLGNSLDWIKERILEFLAQLMPMLDTQSPELANLGSEVLYPLLRMLSTKEAALSLEVLSQSLEVNVTPKDRHVLRLSLLKLARARKDVSAKELSTFCVSENTGWIRGNAEEDMLKAREGIYAVYERLSESGPSVMDDTRGLRFAEDYQEVIVARTEPSRSDGSAGAGDYASSFGDIVTALNDLDQFFTTSSPQSSFDFSASSQHRRDPRSTDRVVPEYDQKVASILRRSLGKALAPASTGQSHDNSDLFSTLNSTHHTAYSLSGIGYQYSAAFTEAPHDLGAHALHERQISVASSVDAQMAEDEASDADDDDGYDEDDDNVQQDMLQSAGREPYRSSSDVRPPFRRLVSADNEAERVIDAFELEETYDTGRGMSKKKGSSGRKGEPVADTSRSPSLSIMFGSSPRRDRRIAKSSRNLQVEASAEHENGMRHASEGILRSSQSSSSIFGALRRSSALSLRSSEVL